MSMMNEKEYRIEELGLDFAKEIITNDRDQNGKSKKTLNRKTTSKYQLIDLNLSDFEKKSLKKLWDCKSRKTKIDQAVLITYWLKENKNIDEITPDYLFSILKILNESVAFDLSSALNNAKNTKQYLKYNKDSKAYKITQLGENYIKSLEEE